MVIIMWMEWLFWATIRWGKLNLQFIVTDFLILHADSWSLFRFQTSKRVREMLGRNSWSPRPCPSITVLEGVEPKCHIIFCIQSEVWNFLKIHAGGDDKLRIQFAWPNAHYINETLYHIPSSCMVLMVQVVKVVNMVRTFDAPIAEMESKTDSWSRKWQISMLQS